MREVLPQLSRVSSSGGAPAVLYVNSKHPQCGIYQFGRAIGEALGKASRYRFVYGEFESACDLFEAAAKLKPVAVIYNYAFETMPWLTKRVAAALDGPRIGVIHEIDQMAADAAQPDIFEFYIGADPTLLLRNPLVFKTGRLLPAYKNEFPLKQPPVIGTWGFGYAGKGFEQVVVRVQAEFDSATIRLHVPASTFMDPEGKEAQAIADRCRDLIVKPGIELKISHEFLSPEGMLDFLAQNTLNAFFYAENRGRGISSVLDFALAVDRPVALTKSYMFRHLFGARPSIFIEDRSLHEIIASGTAPLARFRREWTTENLAWDLEQIVDKALRAHEANLRLGFRSTVKRKIRMRQLAIATNLSHHFAKKQATIARKLFGSTWADEGAEAIYEPRVLGPTREAAIGSQSAERRYNRILDDQARELYRPTIALLFALVPDAMRRKIPAANVQQAFVFDAVRRLAPAGARILSVGSFDDTACLALKAIGIEVDEIDPVLNYSLDEFVRRPSTVQRSYDVVFATSVIEHVEEDEPFMRDLAGLLKPGGVAILTCDYNDQYRKGDSIPTVCHRMYTQKDFRERLIPSARNCTLVDAPDWNCPRPDFVLAGQFRYTFASLVLRKDWV